MMHEAGRGGGGEWLVLFYYPDSIFVSWGVLMDFAHDKGRESRFGRKALSLDKQRLEIIA